MLTLHINHNLSFSEYFYRAYEWVLGNDWVETVACNCRKGHVSWEYSARKGGLISIKSLICPTCKKQISIIIN